MPKPVSHMQSSDAEIVHSLNSPPPGISYVDKALSQGGMPKLDSDFKKAIADPNSEERKRMDNEQAELWAMVIAHQETIKMSLQLADERKASLFLQQQTKEAERIEDEKRLKLADQFRAEREKEQQAQEQLAQQLKQLEADKARIQEMLQNIREQKAEVQKQLNELRTDLGAVQKQIQVLEGQIQVKRNEVMELESQHEDLVAAQREAVRRLDDAAINHNKGLREKLYNNALQNYQDMENLLDRLEKENKEGDNNPKVQAEIERRRQCNRDYLANIEASKTKADELHKGMPKVLEDVQKYRKEQALPEIHKNEQARLTTLMFDIRAAAADKMNLKEVQILPDKNGDIFAPAAKLLQDNAKKQRTDVRKDIDSFPEKIREQQEEIMKIRYRQDKVQGQLVAAREELDSMMNKQNTLKTQVIELQDKIRILGEKLEYLETDEQDALTKLKDIQDQQMEARKGQPFVSPAISEAAREIHLPSQPHMIRNSEQTDASMQGTAESNVPPLTEEKHEEHVAAAEKGPDPVEEQKVKPSVIEEEALRQKRDDLLSLDDEEEESPQQAPSTPQFRH